MEAELRICLNFSSKEYERETTREDLADLLLTLRQGFGAARVQLNEACQYISVLDFSTTDLALVKKTARELRIAIICDVEERLSKSEIRRLRFARLTIEGDSVDKDSDGNPLNRFPSSLCPECIMPDESRLPSTFYVSAKQMVRRRQDGVYGVTLPTKREIFSCSCGVFVASDRVRRVLEVLQQPFRYASVTATPARELPFQFWAIRPVQTWGRIKYLKLSDPCPHCGQPQRCHSDADAEPKVLWPNRLFLQEDSIPDTDLVCCETWFGDRTRRPSESFDFLRDVFVSGRLYDVLLRAKIQGLIVPEEFVSVGDMIPVVEDKTAQVWVESKLELLKSEGLVG